MEPSSHPLHFAMQVMSDLHLETPRNLPIYKDFHVEPQADCLALIGDIGSVHDDRLYTFLESLLYKFRVLFYVLGNHEPYQPDGQACDGPPTYDTARAKMTEFENKMDRRRSQTPEDPSKWPGKFVFMHQRRWDVNEHITILGCTLFSHVHADQESTAYLFVSDFSNLENWTIQSHNDAHAADLAWLNNQVSHISRAEPQRRVVVLTHHSPSIRPEANSPDHLEDSRDVNSAFVTDLSGEVCWTSGSVVVWAFGHTHWNCDYVDKESGKRVVANQRGYGREDIFDFDPNKCIAL